MFTKFFILGITTLILISCSNPQDTACAELDSNLNEVFIEINQFLDQKSEDCTQFEKKPEPQRERFPNETDAEWSEYLLYKASENLFATETGAFKQCKERNLQLIASQKDEAVYLLPLINFSAKIWPSINDEDLKSTLKEIANKNNIEQNLLSIYTICDIDEKELP